MIRFHNVSLRYATGFEALQNVSFRLPQGSFHFITGHSGAGKTSILRLIYRAQVPTQGSVVVAGRSVERLDSRQLPALRRGIGVIFQDYKLLYDRSAFENVTLALEVAGHDPARIPAAAHRVLQYVGLEHRMHDNPVALSGGEQQRVAIARAIVNRPALIIADEPTGNLDRSMGRAILGLFDALHRQGATVLLVTHDLDLASTLGHPRIEMAEGRIIALPESARPDAPPSPGNTP
ncbi:MAG: cell division ATP-binding protein FtsE [Magnetococcus sp. WYHC-3]